MKRKDDELAVGQERREEGTGPFVVLKIDAEAGIVLARWPYRFPKGTCNETWMPIVRAEKSPLITIPREASE